VHRKTVVEGGEVAWLHDGSGASIHNHPAKPKPQPEANPLGLVRQFRSQLERCYDLRLPMLQQEGHSGNHSGTYGEIGADDPFNQPDLKFRHIDPEQGRFLFGR
jgi:hypothetical protein